MSDKFRRRLRVARRFHSIAGTGVIVLGIFAVSPALSTQLAQPANRDAQPEAAKVLRYLAGLPFRQASRVLVGQNVGSANLDLAGGYNKFFRTLESQTGKTPAILAVDYGWEKVVPEKLTQANQLLIAHWRRGGLVTISMHPSNPWTGGGVRDRSFGGYRYEDAVTPGTEVHARWRTVLDNIATGLEELRDAGVVVLWRPLHEMNGDFFWWSGGDDGKRATPAQYRALWRDMFEYFSRERKLDNLLWVYAPNAEINDITKPAMHYYPGDDVVDVVGLDFYDNTLAPLDARGSYRALVGTGKPMALTEVGPAFWLMAHPRGNFDTRLVVNAIRQQYPRFAYFIFWHGWSALLMNARMAIVENAFAKEMLSDPWVVTLDRLDWKR